MHTQIIGRTMTGKTTLAEILARQSNRPVLVVDPVGNPDKWGKHAQIFDSVDALLIAAKKQTNCLLIVDESALSFDRYDPSQLWIAKTSRHNGHSAVFIGQNMVDTPKGIRTQCQQFFIFASSRTDAKFLADEFACDALLEVPFLEVGEFYRIVSPHKIWKGHVELPSKIILDKEEKREHLIDRVKRKR